MASEMIKVRCSVNPSRMDETVRVVFLVVLLLLMKSTMEAKDEAGLY